MTPIIGMALLLGITISLALTVLTMTNNLVPETSPSEKVEILPSQINMEIESKVGGNVYMEVINNGEKAIRPEFYTSRGEDISHAGSSIVEPGERRTFKLRCVPQGSKMINSRVNDFEKEARITGDFPSTYCINITDTSVDVSQSGGQTFKVFEGRAYVNNEDKDAYSNKDLEISFDGDRRTVTTNSSGEFMIREKWSIDYLPENAYWKKKIRYESQTPVVDFHLGRGRFQPPNRVRLDFRDGGKSVYQTQEVFEATEGSNADISYNIEPADVSDDSVSLKFSMRIKAKQDMVDDFNNNPDSDLLYQVPIPYSGDASAECSSSSSVDCSTGEVSFSLSSPTGNTRFDRSSLPEKNGEKYMPVKLNFSTEGRRAIAGLNPYLYFEHGGTEYNNPSFSNKWYFFGNRKRMAYVNGGDDYSTYINLSLDDLRNTIESQVGSGSTINVSYRIRQNLVTSPIGWSNPPSLARNNVHFSLEHPTESNTPASDNDDIETVLYEWNDIQQGEDYYLNFTVDLPRGNSRRAFYLPTFQGTFGMFPEDGGDALGVGSRYGAYTKGGLRYPRFRREGLYSFRTTVPPLDQEEGALVYKTTIPKANDEWVARTFVLNTGDEKIDRIFLLNSRGEWHDFTETLDGDERLDAGEKHNGSFQIDKEPSERIQMNLQYQMINGGASEPDYTDWPYSFNLTVKNQSWSQKYDISDDTRCNTRYCLSYRIGNREVARPIDRLRGNSAPTSFYDNLTEVSFDLKNGQDSPDVASQRIKFFRFWVWYLKPFNDDLENYLDIENPDQLDIRTLEGPYNQGSLRRKFE